MLNPKVVDKEKNINHHPWENTKKEEFFNQIKHAHKYVETKPCYPEEKVKVRGKERIKLTVIGNMVTKEFIYCVHLVKGICKYRSKSFDDPVIRGVTSVEWPGILNDLKLKYGGLAYCLKSQVAVLNNEDFLGGEQELKEFIETKYIYHVCVDSQKESVAQFVNFVKCSGRPCAYLHISINDEHIGTMIFMLYADIAPYACENFLRLCEEKRGGYAGTPVHRIVKDGWIQCGGFGLKSTDLGCENFIVSHDRRGVLGMANDGRHNDCSTQFFVLLQPAPWMAHKYVAIGQLIDGETTLERIERVPTWYESPTSEIIIYRAGVLNLVGQDISINSEANKYIQGHIEDLVTLGKLLTKALMENVFREITFRNTMRLVQNGERESDDEGRSVREGKETMANLHATKRFMRTKKEIYDQEAQNDSGRSSSGGHSSAVSRASKTSEDTKDNVDFDLEDYDYEAEEYFYPHESLPVVSPPPKPDKLFYIPLTDVPYPGEVDSTYDLKKFLKGDYCLQSDLFPKKPEIMKYKMDHKMSYNMSNVLQATPSSHEDKQWEYEILDSEDEREIEDVITQNMEKVSHAGGVIQKITRGAAEVNLFDKFSRSKMFTDDQLRRVRLASIDSKAPDDKRVISKGQGDKKIRRRQTGFIRKEDLEKLSILHDEDQERKQKNEIQKATEFSRKVRIASSSWSKLKDETTLDKLHRPTSYVNKNLEKYTTNDKEYRPSVLTRLYKQVTLDADEAPTLKNYMPFFSSFNCNNPHLRQATKLFDTNSSQTSTSQTSNKDSKVFNQQLIREDTFDFLNKRYRILIDPNTSTEYVNVDQHRKDEENISITRWEYSKTRPSMTIADYQSINQKYQEDMKIPTIESFQPAPNSL